MMVNAPSHVNQTVASNAYRPVLGYQMESKGGSGSRGVTRNLRSAHGSTRQSMFLKPNQNIAGEL